MSNIFGLVLSFLTDTFYFVYRDKVNERDLARVRQDDEQRKQQLMADFRTKEAERRAFEEKVANAPPAPPPPQKQ